MSTSNVKGRKQGSLNRMTQETKQELKEAVLPQLQQVFKGINSLDPEKRIAIAIKCLPYFLSKGKVSNEETEVQQILFKQLLPHYNRFEMYFSHLPTDERAKVLVQLLKMLTPQQISTVAPVMTKRLKGRDKGKDK